MSDLTIWAWLVAVLVTVTGRFAVACLVVISNISPAVSLYNSPLR